MAEWSNAAVLKTVSCARRLGGSNPSPSATHFSLFFRLVSYRGDGFKALAEGQAVEFDIIEDAKGAKAQNVVRG